MLKFAESSIMTSLSYARLTESFNSAIECSILVFASLLRGWNRRLSLGHAPLDPSSPSHDPSLVSPKVALR